MNEPMRLYKRGGTYYVEFSRGKKKSLRTADEKMAAAVFREMEREYLRGRLLNIDDYKKVTLSDFSAKYSRSRIGISRHTIRKDELALKLLGDVIGGSTQLRAVTSGKLDEFKKICLARGAKEITINGYLRHIKAAFTWALDEGYLAKKPKFKMFRKKGEELPRILAVDDINKLLEKSLELDPEAWRYFTFQLWTGARRREGLGVQWQHINFAAGEVTLTGKTGSRTIPLLGQVKAVLGPIKKDLGHVFTQYHPDTWSHRFEQIAAAAGVRARLHDLRHTCATFLLKSGVTLETVKKILGHANIATTEIYAKVLREEMKKQMSKLRFE